MKEIKIALVGFGGIARSHFAAYTALKKQGLPLHVVAICDANAEQFKTQISINTSAFTVKIDEDTHLYTSVDDMIEKEAFDAADVCLPTFLHKEVTLKLLRADKHVLCEKPMALCVEDCREMVRAAEEHGRRLLIGHCLRFSPEYLYIKRLIDEKPYGELLSMHMHRASMSPSWSAGNWLQDVKKSGGCILDTHIHDIDIANFFFGVPDAVSTLECSAPPYWQTQNTRLFYPSVTVVADGSWHDMPNTKFTAGCKLRFARANVILELDKLTVYPDGEEPFTPETECISGIDAEIAYFADLLLSPAPQNEHTPQEILNSVRIVERMRESAAQNGAVLPMDH